MRRLMREEEEDRMRDMKRREAEEDEQRRLMVLEEAKHNDELFMKELERGFPVSGSIDAGCVWIPDQGERLAHGKPAHGVCP